MKWELRNPLPQANFLYSVLYGSNIFVAIGNNGTILTSNDGAAWTQELSGTSASLKALSWGNGRFVIVGESGAVLTSDDGKVWVKRNPGTTHTLLSVTFGDGRFVAVGDSGTILSSNDGKEWTQEDSRVSINLVSVVHGKGQFMALGEGGPGGAVGSIFTSLDSNTWEFIAKPDYYMMNSIAYGNGKFVAGSFRGLLTSSPGDTNWTSQSLGTADDSFHSVTYAGNQFIVLTSGPNIMTSSDGTNWISRSTGIDGFMQSIAYGSGVFVVVGSEGRMLTSPDLSVWSARSSGVYCNFRFVTYAHDRFLALGTLLDSERSCLTTSDHGIEWSLNPQEMDFEPHTAAYGNGRFVVVAGDRGTIMTSPDAKDWTHARTFHPLLEESGVAPISCALAYGNNRFVVLANYSTRSQPPSVEIWMSPDGTSWNRATSGPGIGLKEISSLVYAGGRFVAVGREGISISSDGERWTVVLQRPTTRLVPVLNFVAYGNGQYVAVGSAAILTSSDGINWVSRDVDSTDEYVSVVYAKDHFVAVGREGFTPVILTSPDGASWEKTRFGLVNFLQSVAYGEDQVVIVGNRGEIFSRKTEEPVTVFREKPGEFKSRKITVTIPGSRIPLIIPMGISDDDLEISVTDMSGRKIHTASGGIHEGNLDIPRLNLGRGIFILSVASGKWVRASKIFVTTK